MPYTAHDVCEHALALEVTLWGRIETSRNAWYKGLPLSRLLVGLYGRWMVLRELV